MIFHNSQSGTTLIETLIAAVLLTLLLAAFIGSLSTLALVQVKARLKTEAVQLTREYSEIAYNLSLQNWNAFSQIDGTYTLHIRDNPDYDLDFPYYELQDPSLFSDESFTRTITFGPTFRDPNGKITSDKQNGTPDPDTRQITVITKFNKSDTIEDTIFETYLMNFNGL